MEWLTFLLCLLAFMGFAVAKPNHYKEVFGTRPKGNVTSQLTIASWLCLCGSLALALTTQGTYGSLEFIGYTTLAVLLLVVIFATKPSYFRSLFYLVIIGMLVSTLYWIIF
ncbi:MULTISPECIES: DUF3325 domain-containing protein [Pseudoalteromonas]|uniref:DUF3325 domain-containing protein n=1 Tax=Pseudoalteromonas TaxID=53246 RepID=UPI000FFF4667|nr:MULTISPECIES: DUF3325 domain-containing protein [Pseudoalteromonas]MCG9759640.1 DUF3325 domain-containing protein [Pseudoalteromonas sp. Isolate6]NKC21005.1 DUF3325 family protein [Pseudoalteromonas galatheae]RXE86405.1 DUF3325 domain-containing protein [Pseudoalteromonas sp. A757]